MPKKNWKQELNQTINFIAHNHSKNRKQFLNANAEMVRRVVEGQGSDDRTPDDGAWIVCNISSAHIPAFCKTLYKNGYDLGTYRIGVKGKITPSETRRSVFAYRRRNEFQGYLFLCRGDKRFRNTFLR